MKNRLITDKWSSRLGFIIATAGAAIGLGNIWRFPYMAGTQGGGAFVVVFLACVLLIGIPMMLAEMAIGRRARKNPVSALDELAQSSGHSQRWRFVGVLGALTALLILSFYSVVGGWSIYYFLQAATGAFNHTSTEGIQHIWTGLMENPLQMTLWHSVFIVLTIAVIAAGVVNGIERATKIMMPALYVMLIILVCYAYQNGYFAQAWHFLFDFRVSQITPHVVIAALGHAAFSLAVGVGALLIYAAYTPQKSKLVSSVFIVVVLDVLVAIMAGLAIFPLVFRFGLTPSSGPGLMYQTLPIAFAHIASGQWVGCVFFLLLIFAAWTSSINLAEPVVAVVCDWLNCKRSHASMLVGAFAWALGLLSALSSNMLSTVHINGMDLFSFISNLATDILCPLGGIGFALFAGWIMLKQDNQSSLKTSPFIFNTWYFLIRYIAPVAIAVIFMSVL